MSYILTKQRLQPANKVERTNCKIRKQKIRQRRERERKQRGSGAPQRTVTGSKSAPNNNGKNKKTNKYNNKINVA